MNGLVLWTRLVVCMFGLVCGVCCDLWFCWCYWFDCLCWCWWCFLLFRVGFVVYVVLVGLIVAVFAFALVLMGFVSSGGWFGVCCLVVSVCDLGWRL